MTLVAERSTAAVLASARTGVAGGSAWPVGSC